MCSRTTPSTRPPPKYNLPELRTLGTETSDVFPETSLVGELQAGQLDAGFFYGVEASAANIKTVPLTGTSLAGDYTITILNKAPHEAAAVGLREFPARSGRSEDPGGQRGGGKPRLR